MQHIINILKGIVIGIANSIPGVSGGTMMVITKVFDRLMGIIGGISIKKIKDNFFFLFTLALGMGIGIIVSATVLDICFERFYVQTQFFFMGVVLGSLPAIYKEATSQGKFRPIHAIPFAAGFAVMIAVTLISRSVHNASVITELTPGSAVYLFIVSVFAAAAMIMPGLSGSLVMLILGGYQTVIEAVSLDNIFTRFPLLIPVFIGIIAGVLICAKVMTAALEKARLGTYASILGLITASFFAIWPRQTVTTEIVDGVERTVVTGADFTFDISGLIAVVFFIIGAVIPLIFMRADKKAEDRNA
ncbi:MAG: DUF368 domain-containing protein [Oscillospiraceae bacterium]|nr:DUF368 domain-containing protein [Oscillospiraceae bacterium]